MAISAKKTNSVAGQGSESVEKLVWIQLSVMCFFSVFQFLLQGSVGVFAEGMKASYQIDAAGIGLLSSAFFYSYIAMQVPAGIVYDRFGVRKVAFSAVFVMVLGCLLLSWAPTLHLAVISRILMGIGCSCGFVGLLFGIKKWFPENQFALIIALSECVSMAGAGLANNLLSHAVEGFGWRYALAGCGGIAALLLFSVYLFVAPEKSRASSGDTTESAVDSQVPAWHVIKIKEVWVGGFFSAFMFAVLSVFVALWAIPFLGSVYMMDVVSATSVASTVYIGIALSSPLIGWASSRVSLSSLMSLGSGGTAVLMFFIVSAPAIPLYGLHTAMFFLGFCCAVYQFSFALVGRQAPAGLQGAAMGTTNMITMSAALIFQPLIGFMISSQNGQVLDGFENYQPHVYQNALSVLPWCMVVAFTLSLFLRDEGVVGIRKILSSFSRIVSRPVKSVVE